jgi:methylated-DNA-protein-cysteine methyltransferase related protein
VAPPEFEDDVRRVLERLPSGTVMTYGELALEAGHPGAARAVGTFLARSATGLPWWRVVTSIGRLVPGHESEHAQRLRSEGVCLANGRVVMRARSGDHK